MPLKILAVDDEPDVPLLIRQQFRKQIQEKAVEFRFAANGVEALAALEAEPDIDMVLSDINMPEMDGLTLLSKLTGRGPLPKTVIVSAYGDMDNIRVAMNLGAFDFVTKPIDFKDLRVTIDKTHAELKTLKQALAIRDELVSLRRELEIAASIQRALLPAGLPAETRGAVDVSAHMTPAAEVGGDLYDLLMTGDDELYFCVGDVSGKGVPAVLLMLVTQTLLRTAAQRPGADPAEMLTAVNAELRAKNETMMMFVTLVCGFLRLSTGELRYSNAGHNRPIIIRGGAPAQWLSLPSGLVLGVMDDVPYETVTTALAPGDKLLVYTDGVTEAQDINSKLYSDEKLLEVAEAHRSAAAGEMIDAVVKSVKEHVQDAPQSDDITVVAITLPVRRV
jgi:sigma-B regulation protein RsbU (phosphoserine phosphatase)